MNERIRDAEDLKRITFSGGCLSRRGLNSRRLDARAFRVSRPVRAAFVEACGNPCAIRASLKGVSRRPAAICVMQHKDAFPHPVVGYSDFTHGRAFIATKIRKIDAQKANGAAAAGCVTRPGRSFDGTVTPWRFIASHGFLRLRLPRPSNIDQVDLDSGRALAFSASSLDMGAGRHVGRLIQGLSRA
jgi:hypothetical protein